MKRVDHPVSTLPPGLIQAYRDTHYQVPGLALTLVVDQPNPALELAHRQHRSDCSAFITACNPYSAELTSAENDVRQMNLASELKTRGLAFVDGIGQHPTNGWAGEPSFLVFGLPLEAAKTLCARLEQNGFVWSGADAVPRLIVCESQRAPARRTKANDVCRRAARSGQFTATASPHRTQSEQVSVAVRSNDRLNRAVTLAACS